MAIDLFLPKLTGFLCSILAISGVLRLREFTRPAETISDSGSTFPPPQLLPAAAHGICKSRVEIFGYECEEHTVTTRDGYILSLQRIHRGRSHAPTGRRRRRTPVLLQHGVLVDGVSWLLNSPEESLGYILADRGFDVWIANGRGTVYSRRHVSLAPNDSAYWDWSWDQLAAYDLPAIVKYVYNHSSQQRLHFVGHSLGTLMSLASFSRKKSVNMVRSAVMLSPIAYLNHLTSALLLAAADAFAAETYYWLGLKEFNPVGKEVQRLLLKLCEEPGVNCYDMFAAITGKNCCLNTSSIDVLLNHEPQPTATRNLIHMSQMVRRGTINRYDFDSAEENLKHYGRTTPPEYNLSAIPNDLPLLFIHGGRDRLSDVRDVKHLLDRLKLHHRDHELKVIYLENYAHADFIMAVNAKELVYEHLIAFFKLH